MQIRLFIVALNIVLIFVYLIARNRENLKLTAIIQPMTTFLSLIIAASSLLIPAANKSYTIWILIGMGLCFAADIFNIDMNNDKIFIAGIIFFTVAYLEYAAAFTIFNKGFQRQDILVGIIFFAIYVLLIRLYWKNLGQYKLPIMIYGLILPFMVTRAISTIFGGIFPMTTAILISVGSMMLFLGDAEYGMHRFYKKGKFVIGPICYAGGQLLIAISCVTFIV